MLISEERMETYPEELHGAANVRLYEGMYAEAAQRSLGFTGYLETLDPSGSSNSLDAYERQLALAGIRISGDDADIIDRFFASQESAVLFPEYVSRSVQIGFDDFTKLKKIVAARVKIDDNTYKSIFMDDSIFEDGEKSLAVAGEGAELPKIEIKTSDHTVQIQKYGRYLHATYEAIRRKRANVVSMFLRAIGVQLQRDKFQDAVSVLIDGDGNSNAASTMDTAASGTLTYADMIDFILSFEPYDANVLVCNKTTAAKLLKITEVKEHIAENDLKIRGDNVRLFGAELLIDASVTGDVIIGLDRRFALHEVFETGVMTESERLIRRQIEGTAISEVAGFAKGITGACKVLNVTHA